jgi:hypothetical protein
MMKRISDEAACEAYQAMWHSPSEAFNRVPDYMRGAFCRWVVWGIPGGDFLDAFVNNDLMGAIRKADDENLDAFPQWARLFYNGAPAACFGAERLVARWIALGGIAGRCGDCEGHLSIPGDADTERVDVNGGHICARCAEKRSDMKHAAQIMGG